jgi:hypothetical protein
VLKLKQTIDGSSIGMAGCAKLLGVSERTLYNKLTEVSVFSYPEYLTLKKLFPACNVSHLLTSENETETAVPALETRERREVCEDLGGQGREVLISQYESEIRQLTRRVEKLKAGASPADIIF